MESPRDSVLQSFSGWTMNIIFMGTPDFAVPSLAALINGGHTVSAVVTAPDRPRGRGQQVSFTPVKEFALRHGIRALQPESLKDPQFISDLRAFDPDVFVVVAFRILPKEVYTIPKKGSFNLHASLLPKYRGAAPINWAIMNGESESGVTTFFLQDKVDTGNIILQRAVPIPPDMNAGELHDALSTVGADVVSETVRLIEIGVTRPERQNDMLASPAPKIFKDTGRIDWNQPAVKIHNFVRGLSPYPSAWTVHQGKVIKIYRTRPTGKKAVGDEGMITADGISLSVSTSDGMLEILELQQEGKKRLNAEEFLRGYRFGDSVRFE